jgi:hypothetical protein
MTDRCKRSLSRFCWDQHQSGSTRLEIAPLRLRSLPTAFFHVLQSSEQVLRGMVKMSKIYFVKVATLCLFDFAKLQRELSS